ncbi:extracellular solute-binding protein [Erwinia mallotivora]|uniref:extracellular solute-binding protein n=1 Tax=Erwinia mallotivora TaxID=69222 RepID=UPI0035E773A3
MTTIKDIARLAGVSHGTVSNVINERGNVSVAKINAVKAAIEQLGYQANTQAKTLRGGVSRIVALVVPEMQSERYRDLYTGMNDFLKNHNYRVEIFITADNEEIEKKQLEILGSNQCCGVGIVSSLSDAEHFYKKLSISRDKIIFIYRNPIGCRKFLNIEFKAAIRHFYGVVKEKGYRNIVLFTESERYSNVKEFKQYLTESLADVNNIAIHTFSSLNNQCHKVAFDIFQHSSPDVVICTDFEKVRYLRNACHLGSLRECPPIYTLSGGNLHLEQDLYCYSMNYEGLGKRIANLLIDTPENIPEKNINLFDEFKIFCASAHHPYQVGPIKLLTIPSPTTVALIKLLPHFYRTYGVEVEIIQVPFNELIKIASKPSDFFNFDIIRIDIATLPWLAEEIFEPLDKISPCLLPLLENFTDTIIDRYSRVNEVAYALPFDPSTQILFYRRDLFENQKIKRMYFEKFHHEMTVPINFEQFDMLSVFFNQLYESGEINVTGSCINIGGEEVIATEFLLRYYAKGGRLLCNNTFPELDTKIAEVTLREYIKSMHNALIIKSNWWQDSISRFESGDLSMLLIYENLFSETAYSKISSLIGHASVPGGTPLLGGGSIGITKNSKNKSAAGKFLKWLFSATITEQIVLLGGRSASSCQRNSEKIADLYPWLPLTEKSLLSGIRENSFDDGKYFNLNSAEKIIGRGIESVITGNTNIENAIKIISDNLKKL